MAFSIHTNHRLVLLFPATIYVVLVGVCAIWPAMQEKQAERDVERQFEDALVVRGRHLYGSLNCVTCHTQQIRGDARLTQLIDGVERVPVLRADARFGREHASRAAEYAWQDPVYMGTQRTGPDLSAVGRRLPEAQWHYWHLYHPRSVSPDSIMPPHRFLFTTEPPPADREFDYDEVLKIEGLGAPGDRLWAKPDAKALVEYLLSLNRDVGNEGLGR